MNPLDSPWIQLGCRQIELFEKDSVSFMNLMVTSSCLRAIMETVYKSIVRYGLADPIEKVSIAEKTILWDRAKDIAAGKLNHEQCIQLSKGLYAIECFLTK